MLSLMPVSVDRRSALRVPVRLRVKFKDLGRPGESFKEVTRDVSSGGIFVESSVGFTVGTSVEVEVELHDGRSLCFVAEVVRIEEEPGEEGSVMSMGMRSRGLALKLSDADPEALIRLLSEVKSGDSESVDISL